MRATMVAAAVLACAVSSGCAPAPLTPNEIVAAFIAASQDDARTMHMEWQGTTHTSQLGDEPGMLDTDANLTATFEFSGADYEGVLVTAGGGQFGGAGGTVGYARVGGASFTRFDGGSWQRTDGSLATPLSFDPLTGLTAADVTYEGPDDGQVIRLRVNDPLGALQRTVLPVGGVGEMSLVEGGASEFLVFVDYAGIPVSARLDIDAIVSFAMPDFEAPDIQFGFTSDYQFSDWGAEITILPPQAIDPRIRPPDLPEKLPPVIN